MIDRRQHGEEREPKAQAPDDQLLLDRQQRLEGGGAQTIKDGTVGWEHEGAGDRMHLFLAKQPHAK
jgi:hypothetical protein